MSTITSAALQSSKAFVLPPPFSSPPTAYPSLSRPSSPTMFSNFQRNRPILPASFSANQPKTIRLYPLSNYTFGTKENQPEEDPSVLARLQRLQEHYEQYGMRRTCEGILVCHEHCHPHILMLQIANAFFKLYIPFRFPVYSIFSNIRGEPKDQATTSNITRPN